MINDGRLLLTSTDDKESALALPRDCEGACALAEGEFCFGPYRARRVDVVPSGLYPIELRESWGKITEAEFAAASKGVELLNWDDSSRFCGHCGGSLRRFCDIGKRCVCCGREYFPNLNPAVIVLVTKGDKALLVHARNFRKPFYALVAGFVETGENLEQCVAREVEEETSLKIRNIRYFGSQSWPFPSQLMIGFTAEWESGEIRFADGELTDGGFFSRDSLPMLPSLPSISRVLIDHWLSSGE